MHKMSSSTL